MVLCVFHDFNQVCSCQMSFMVSISKFCLITRFSYYSDFTLGTYTPAPGGPFSALTPSMWPQDILAKYHQVRIRSTLLFMSQPSHLCVLFLQQTSIFKWGKKG